MEEGKEKGNQEIVQKKMGKGEFTKLITEIGLGIPQRRGDNVCLVPNDDDADLKFQLKFIPDSLNPQQKKDLAKALATDALNYPNDSILGKAELPEGYGFDPEILKTILQSTLEDKKNEAVKLVKQVNKAKEEFYPFVFTGLVAFGVGLGVAPLIGIAVYTAVAAAFPPLLIASMVALTAISLVLLGVARYKAFQEREAVAKLTPLLKEVGSLGSLLCEPLPDYVNKSNLISDLDRVAWKANHSAGTALRNNFEKQNTELEDSTGTQTFTKLYTKGEGDLNEKDEQEKNLNKDQTQSGGFTPLKK